MQPRCQDIVAAHGRHRLGTEWRRALRTRLSGPAEQAFGLRVVGMPLLHLVPQLLRRLAEAAGADRPHRLGPVSLHVRAAAAGPAAVCLRLHQRDVGGAPVKDLLVARTHATAGRQRVDEPRPHSRVEVLEQGAHVLAKVRVAAGLNCPAASLRLASEDAMKKRTKGNSPTEGDDERGGSYC